MILVAWIYVILFIKVISNYNEFDLPIQDLKESEQIQIAEKVYLHIDRVSFITGDDIWFKAYVIDPSTNKLSINTNNLHVELIAPDSKIILSRTVMINGGVGNGDFHLADSVPSGKYRIRAYTNYMRNYDGNFFFLKEITIINPYDDGQGLNLKIQNIENRIDISFFPEGGSLVDGVSSIVAFKAINALGKGCEVSGEIYSSKGDSVTSFKSTHLGMGTFILSPVPGLKYNAIVRSQDGARTNISLPGSFPTGLAINTFITEDKKLFIAVNTNERTLQTMNGKDLNLFMSSRNLINKGTNLKITSLTNNYLIPIDYFPEGILKITLAGIEGLPVCERLVYYHKNKDISLNISTDKKVYKPREQVKVELSIAGDSLLIYSGAFSLSATKEQYTSDAAAYSTSIASWFLLESDVRGHIEEPSYYFDPSNEDRLQKLDLLLMTQGWRDFQWKYDSLSSFRHEVGFTISGSVKRIINNNPMNGVKINLALFENYTSRFFDTNSDIDGFYKFENLDIIGKAELFISSTDKIERMSGKIYVDSIHYDPPGITELKPNTFDMMPDTNSFSRFQQEIVTKNAIKKKYTLNDTIEVGEVFIIAKRPDSPQEKRVNEVRRVYGTPDKELVVPSTMDNYGGDVLSYMSGRIAGLRVVRGINQNSMNYPNDIEIFIRGQFTVEKKNGIDYKRGALIMLDGYEIDTLSLGKILTLPMYMVDRIDVLNSSPLYGMRGANGVVNIITRTGMRREDRKLSPNSIYTTVNGFNVPRVFYAPNYDTSIEQDNVPDFRTTIFWKPFIDIKTSKNMTLNYYNADDPGTIDITVEGITTEGIPITGRVKYDIN